MKTYKSDFMNYQLPAATKDKQLYYGIRLYYSIKTFGIIVRIHVSAATKDKTINYSSGISSWNQFMYQPVQKTQELLITRPKNYWCFTIWKARGTLNYCRSELLLLLFKRYAEYFLLFIFVVFFSFSPI
jgi:hypothetical protein